MPDCTSALAKLDVLVVVVVVFLSSHPLQGGGAHPAPAGDSGPPFPLHVHDPSQCCHPQDPPEAAGEPTGQLHSGGRDHGGGHRPHVSCHVCGNSLCWLHYPGA